MRFNQEIALSTIEIGIDFGTTNSSVDTTELNEVQIQKNVLADESTPSVIYADRKGNIVVGSKAKRVINKSKEILQNNKAKIKRLMGSAENVSMKIKLFVMLCAALCLCRGLVFADSCPVEPSTQAFLSEYYYSPERSQQEYSKLLYAVDKGYRTIAFKLLESGENSNYQPQGNRKISTPFILAVYNEDEELVTAMIKKGADVNLRSYLPLPDGEDILNPLLVAVRYNKSENITKMLCESGSIDFNARSYALWHSYVKTDIAKFMIIAETLPNNYMDDLLLTPFRGFLFSDEHKENMLKIAQYLVERGFSIQSALSSALSPAIKSGNKKLMEYFLSLGADVDYVPTHTLTEFNISYNPLFAAIQYRQTDRRSVVSHQPACDQFMVGEMEPFCMLLEAGAEVNFSMKRYIHPTHQHLRYEGFSPLTYAIKNYLHDVLSLLIAYGADVDMQDNSGKTPLIWAVEMNDITAVKLLLSLGASIMQTGNDGRTPMDVACSRRYTPRDSARYQPVLDALIEAEAKLFDGRRL